MKKIILLINLLFSIELYAQSKIIQTPFWSSTYNDQQEIRMTLVQPGIAEDCRNYANFIIQQAKELTAEDLDFARNLPLKGQMKNNYEVEFRLAQLPKQNSQREIILNFSEYQVVDPILEVNFLTLKNITLLSRAGTFADISRKLGLQETEIEIVKNNSVSIITIKIKGRDLVCDLLAKNTLLSAKAQVQLSLNAIDLKAMSKFYSEVENKTLEIKNNTESDFLKAALLGYTYSELFDDRQATNEEMRKKIKFLFTRLFKSNSLELSENWVKSENKSTINYQKTMPLGFVSINIGM